MSTIIGLKELREHAAEVSARVEKGETFVVMRRAKPIFKLVPIEQSLPIDDELKAWTAGAIQRFRPVLESLADK